MNSNSWVERKFPYASNMNKTPAYIMMLLDSKRKCPVCGSEISTTSRGEMDIYKCDMCDLELAVPSDTEKYTEMIGRNDKEK